MNNKVFVLFNLVIMAVVDVLIAMMIDNWSTTRIVSLIMISVPFVLSCIVPFLCPSGDNEYYFGTTTNLVTVGYAVIQLIAGIAFIVTDMEGMIPIIVQVVLCVLAVSLIIVMLANNRTIQSNQQKGRGDKEMVSDARREMKDAFGSASPEMKKVIEPAMDKVNAIAGYGDQYESIDGDILQAATELASASVSGDDDRVKGICDRLIRLCAERRKIR